MNPHPPLARSLLAAVRAQAFGAPGQPFPSLDLAVIAFPRGRSALWANVLFSRENPDGMAAEMSGTAGAVNNVRFDRDLQGDDGESIAWRADADWQRLPWLPLHGSGGQRFVAPYPASLLKLMVAVGVGLGVDSGVLSDWPATLEPMIVTSDNDATTELIALLHRHRLIDALRRRFATSGLPTLQLNDTRADGGWRNADGSGVGHIHMTAWDTARLLWLLDADAPPAPWLPAGSTLLRPATRDHLRGVLQRQRLDHVLSSGSLRGVPGWLPGLPDAPAFAHKTGSTLNYAADAGIVGTAHAHYIVALLTSLGSRHAPPPPCVVPWQVPALGAALHRRMTAVCA